MHGRGLQPGRLDAAEHAPAPLPRHVGPGLHEVERGVDGRAGVDRGRARLRQDLRDAAVGDDGRRRDDVEGLLPPEPQRGEAAAGDAEGGQLEGGDGQALGRAADHLQQQRPGLHAGHEPRDAVGLALVADLVARDVRDRYDGVPHQVLDQLRGQRERLVVRRLQHEAAHVRVEPVLHGPEAAVAQGAHGLHGPPRRRPLPAREQHGQLRRQQPQERPSDLPRHVVPRAVRRRRHVEVQHCVQAQVERRYAAPDDVERAALVRGFYPTLP